MLDLTAVVLGPLATQILGDYGADVIKVEPLTGDIARANGVSRADRGSAGMSSVFLAINRNKRSLAIDLKRSEGIAALRRLLPTVDVVVHNMRNAAMERLGLSFAACTAIAPQIIYCVATGFGEAGPDAGKPALDDVIQAACGLVDLVTHDGREADYVPSLIADKTTGLVLANAILAALFERQCSGKGQYVEVPMFETMVAFTLAEHLGGLSFKPQIGPAGYQRLLNGGRKPAPTIDGHVALLPYTDEDWRRFFDRVGRPDLADEFGHDMQARNARIKEVYIELAAITRTMTTEQLLAVCHELDIAATRIYSIDELPRHPHLQAVELFQVQEHPSVGPIVTLRPTTLFSRTPSDMAVHAPAVGENSIAILREAGLSDLEIGNLCADGVVNSATEPCLQPA